MRELKKVEEPQVLIENREKWLREHLKDPQNKTKKFRYREPNIKSALTKETGFKCVYCESKIGHNTPGDIEHKVPASKVPEKRFVWSNLTVACTECNRRKNDYYSQANSFIDPYVDPVESMVEHHGPIVQWKTSDKRAEVSVKTLGLNGDERIQLITQKIVMLGNVSNLIERWHSEQDTTLKQVLYQQLQEMTTVRYEYSGMILSVLKAKGVL